MKQTNWWMDFVEETTARVIVWVPSAAIFALVAMCLPHTKDSRFYFWLFGSLVITEIFKSFPKVWLEDQRKRMQKK